MLEFMRNHAIKIGLLIVVAFVGTMFAGGFLFQGVLPEKNNVQSGNKSDYIAFIGDYGVSKQQYYQQLNQIVASLPLDQRAYLRLNPELFERIEYQAWEAALQTIILDELSKEADIKVKKKDTEYFLNTFLNENELESKKALKTLLKERNVPYKEFMAGFKNDVRRKIYLSTQKSNIQITEQDIDNQFTSVVLSFYRFNPKKEENQRLSERNWDASKMALQTHLDALEEGVSFEALSDLDVTASVIRDFGNAQSAIVSNLPKPLQSLVLDMKKGEIIPSDVLHSGVYLLRLEDRDVIAKPDTLNKEAVIQSLEQQAYSTLLTESISNWIDGRNMTFQDLRLAAADAKLKGKLSDVIVAYQGMISQMPSNPVPHYLLGKVFLAANNYKMAKLELEKADVKAELLDDFDLPRIHIALAELYSRERLSSKKVEQLDKAIQSSPETILAYEDLKELIEPFKDKKRFSLITKRLDALKDESNVELDQIR